MKAGQAEAIKARVAEKAALARLRERERERPPLYGDPDARERVTSSLRMVWPPGALLTFHGAHVLRNPRPRLYEDLPEGVSPARPRS